MKRNLLAPVILASTGITGAAHADDNLPTVYGKANISLNQSLMENAAGSRTQDNWTLNSNASRLGVKGSYAISDNLKAIYKLEYEVFVDDGDDGSGNSSEFKQRNIYGGFQGNWGTLIAGNHDTPVKLAQGKVDRFNDLILGDIKNVMEGENRVKNIIMYTTPKWGGFSATVASIPGEESGVVQGQGNDGIADGISSALQFKADNLSLALAHDRDVDGIDELTRLVGEFNCDHFKLGVLGQIADKKTSTADSIEDAYLISAEAPVVGKLVAKAQFSKSDDDVNRVRQKAIGFDYKLSKNAKLFAYHADVKTKNNAAQSNDATYALGYEIKF